MFPIFVNIKLPKNVIIVSSSLLQFFSYLDAKTKSELLFINMLYILVSSLGLNDPSALNIQKNFVSTLLFLPINAAP